MSMTRAHAIWTDIAILVGVVLGAVLFQWAWNQL